MVVSEIKKKLRIIYSVAFLLIFATEIFIALYVRDDFIRPYVGDMLATVPIFILSRVVPFRDDKTNR